MIFHLCISSWFPLVVVERFAGIWYCIGMRKLSAKQEAFCGLLASDTPPTIIGAYEKAGYSVAQAGEGQAHHNSVVNASRLANSAPIVERVSAIKKQREKSLTAQTIRAASREEVRRDRIIDELEKLSFGTDEQASVRVKAIQLLGQTLGMYSERVITKQEDRDIETVENELKSRLESIFLNPQ
jgi:hypothetical protein|tara:strand:- start:760 stop:1311 length:552 start_codon:yes stop_codon:yes gene_type:complete